jgi:sugar phosphate isomerase/epimerase
MKGLAIMKLASCTYSYRQPLKSGEMSLEECITTMAELGLDGIELTSYFFPQTDRDYLNHIKRCCFAAGLEVCGTGVGNNFAQADDEKRRADVDMTKEWIDHGAVLGAPCIRIFGGGVPEGESEEEAMARAVECMQECAEHGKKRGVVVALENHGGITATADHMDRLVKAVDHDWFGINLDFGNYRRPDPEFAQTAPLAVTTHAKVTYRDPEGERHPVDYEMVRDVMEGIGYRGYISIEYEEEEPPDTGMPKFVDELKRVFR